MRRGRVLILSDYIGSGAAMGGAGIATLASHRALRAAGIDAQIVTGFLGEGLPQIDGEAVRALGGADLRSGSIGDALRIVYNARSRAQLAPVLAEHDPAQTIVILNQWTRYLTPSSIGLLGRFPVMIYMHDYFWACPNGAYFDFQRGEPCRRQPMGGACLAANCDRQGRAHKIVRLARHAALQLARRGGRDNRLLLHISRLAQRTAEPLLPHERHALLYNPLELPAEPASPARPAYDIGYVGRLEPEKGVARLLDVATARGWSMSFVGEGSLAERIDGTPGATRRAWQPHAAMPALMRDCRAMVLPSLWPETWGLVTAEAMAARVPMLVSARAGSSELVERFGGGLVFDPDAAGDLERALEEILAGPADATAMRPDAFADLRHMLSAEHHAARIAALAFDHFGVRL